ncbi:MAG: InlB B-repeat-containing protein [Lachnospiraceae bacterium]|nr:InlB B-repeat-containing protein [Lachnospiraceae bacterium]
MTNNKSTEAILSFDYVLTLNGGSATIDGNEVPATGTFEKTLGNGDAVSIVLRTQKGDYSTKAVISSISLVADVEVSTTFATAENGSYSVNGTSITEETSMTGRSIEAYSLTAEPAEGYKFLDWYSVTKSASLSSNQNFSYKSDQAQTVTARFVSNDSAIFETAGSQFADLNEAVAFAQSKKANKITLVSDGTLPAGSYAIPNGITLLIPFDDAGTCYTTEPANTPNSYTSPSPYRTLTMASGASIQIAGAMSVSAKHAAAPGGQNYGGSPSGKYGFVKMDSGSSIEVLDGGALYAWGFISGSGRVNARSGSKVYENFQITDFRGGTATSNLASGPIFPFSQYYVQNVEVPMTLEAGATEKVYSSLYAMGGAYSTDVEFIGADGMFKLGSGASITKTYDGAHDRLHLDINGDSELKNLTVKVATATINSSNFNLPINSNISIRLHSGTTTLSQSLALQPGAEVVVDRDVTMKVASGKKIYVYDSDQWGNYTMSAKLISVPYARSKAKNRTAGDLKDALIDLNGEVKASGSVYTTESGANITSSAGTGKFTFESAAGTETTTQQYENNSTKVTIPITSVKLHNADDSYTETAGTEAGTTYYYDKSTGKWSTTEPAADKEIKISFNANEGTGEMEELTSKSNEETTLTANAFTREGYDFKGWNTAADGSGDAYADGAAVTFEEDTVLYAQWEKKTFKVVWKNFDDTTLAEETVAYGEVPSFKGEEPVREETAEFSYTFSGWDPELKAVQSDMTFKAVFEEKRKEYAVTFKNEDGTVLETKKVPYGEKPVYTGETPVKDGNAEYTYTFSGWTPELTEVTGEAEYTAVYTSAVNEYDITWVNWDGTVLQVAAKVAYGKTPEYKGAEPTKPADAQYTYSFSGWDCEVEAVTGDKTYTAVFTETLNEYTITWQNEDGTVLKTETLTYGTTPVYSGETPTKDSDAEHTYSHTGWTPELKAVSGDAVYTAVFSSEPREYNVTWKLSDEDEGLVVPTAYGTQPVYPNDEPTKESDEEYSYTFTGWSPEITDDTLVTEDITYTAQFEKKRIAFTVTWQNYNGDILQKDTLVKEGTVPSYNGATPVRNDKKWHTFTFTGWAPEVAAVTGDVTYSAEFEETGITGWVEDEKGKTYIENGKQKYFEEWAEIDGSTYYFNTEGYIVKGLNTVKEQGGDEYGTFVFDKETGIFRSDLNGLYEDGEDILWVENGRVAEYAGLKKVGDVYYYFDETNKAVRASDQGTDFKVVKNNGLELPEGIKYPFGEDGIICHDDTSWHGIHEIDGKKYDYIDGVRIPRGLFERDGDYYYARTSNGELICGRTYWVSVTNNLLREGRYEFDADGKLIIPAKNGIVEEKGSLYYYVDGEISKAGLIQIGTDYYYVKTSNGEVVHDRSYWVTVTNDLLPKGKYSFDSDGKMINPPTNPDETVGKDGIVSENGSLYYYENGKIAPKGLIKIGDDYYYVRTSNGEVIHGRSYWASVTNGLLPAKSYQFGDDGKMIQ